MKVPKLEELLRDPKHRELLLNPEKAMEIKELLVRFSVEEILRRNLNGHGLAIFQNARSLESALFLKADEFFKRVWA